MDDLRAQGAAEDRPYLEAMLRRLGYTEREIRSELGPMVEADPAPAKQVDFVEGPLTPPTREYRLVVPARESAFWVGDGAATATTDAPFEALERVDFQEVPGDEMEFVDETGKALDEMQDFEVVEDEAAGFQEAPVQEFPVDAPAKDLSDEPIDTFGGPDVGSQTKTRVRVKRVRAHSREEAEGKVASKNRRVIKSIPVDIVERWGGKQ